VALAPGDSFGRYTIVGTLGVGGMGQVLRAVDRVLERTVALKIIRADKADQGEAVARFFREAKLAAQLSHAHVVQIYDLGVLDGIPFIAMEHIDGKPLTVFCGDVSYDPMRKARWLLAAARGLEAAHTRGMVHRDVKPANIMVVADEDVVKVVDFGLAKRLLTTAELRATFQTGLGFLVGTPIFMAPEQFDGADADARSDQFSWGLTAYTLLAGENPRRADPLLLAPIAAIDRRVPGIPADVGDAIMTAIEIVPSRRHASMARVVEQLESALNRPVGRVLASTTEVAAVPPFDVIAHPLAVRPLDHCIQVAGNRDASARPPAPPPSRAATGGLAAGGCSSAVPIAVRRRCWTSPRSPDGKHIVACGGAGVLMHDGGMTWDWFRPTGWLPRHAVTCAALLPDGSAIVGGTEALALRVLPNGQNEYWSPARRRRDISFRGVEITTEGWLTFVGSAQNGGGVIAWATRRERLEVAEAPMPLTAVVTTTDGTGQLACGPRGALISAARGLIRQRTCGVSDLHALATTSDGAFVVGALGHAMFVTSAFETEIESVDTSETLTAVTVSGGGTAWAVSSRGASCAAIRSGAGSTSRTTRGPNVGCSRSRRPRIGCAPSPRTGRS
jgi:hypothetical protein